MVMGTAWKAVGVANTRIQFDSVVFRHCSILLSSAILIESFHMKKIEPKTPIMTWMQAQRQYWIERKKGFWKPKFVIFKVPFIRIR